MQNRRSTDKIKNWARVAASVGALLSRPKVRARINQLFQDRVNSVTDAVSERYDDAVHRVGAAADALRGRPARAEWRMPAMSFAVGLGIGAGLGILLAPTSGAEARGAIRTKAVSFKDTIADSAANIAVRASKTVG